MIWQRCCHESELECDNLKSNHVNDQPNNHAVINMIRIQLNRLLKLSSSTN